MYNFNVTYFLGCTDRQLAFYTDEEHLSESTALLFILT